MKICEVIVDIAHSDVDKIFEYICEDTVKAGMRVTVPFGRRTETGFVMRVKSESVFEKSKLKQIYRVEEGSLPEECVSLSQKISARYFCPLALSLRLFLPAEMRSGKVHEKLITIVSLSGDPAEIPPRAQKQRELADFLKENGETPAPLLRERFGGAVNALKERGLLSFQEKSVLREPYKRAEGEDVRPTLTEAQERALREIEKTKKQVSLLFGVTGSGKTEIYLRLIEESLQRGKGAIFLVPEISLTPQMLRKLRGRFGNDVAILHSRLSAGERYDEWMRLREGSAKIAVGARSAVFAPIEELGIIVIDEEHDGSYRQESAPRYSTAEIAKLRAHYHNCKIVMGSATPSVESFRSALAGEYQLVRLDERILKRPMPEVKIVDMRLETRRGNPSPFSMHLRESLRECLKKGDQAILFLNRRGYSQSLICRDCGYAAKCENCDVSLTYHSEENCLKCHYCGTKYHVPRACPECGGLHFGYKGTGTQRVEKELQTLFPSARILRLDNDTASQKEGHYKILSAFARREGDILVGTQMVAKGHDFPHVTLVGILDADMSLHFSDYRSGERTFQLVTQVGGRSGRAESPGTVILQTYEPENYILRFAANYDFEGFYQNEIAIRESMSFPPFSKIVRVMAVGETEAETIEALREVYGKLSLIYEKNREKFLFFNRMRAPVGRIQRKYRFQVLMRLLDGSVLKDIYEVATSAKFKNVLIYVEENPANLN